MSRGVSVVRRRGRTVEADTPVMAPGIPAAIYTRVSTEEQGAGEFSSIDSQRLLCQEYLVRQGGRLSLVGETFDDIGVSGKTLNRPAFQRLLQRVREGRVKAIVISRLDRVSRSLVDFVGLLKELDEVGASLIMLDPHVDMGTDEGRVFVHMLMVFAEHERKLISKRTREKAVMARQQGRWTGGLVPLGYDLAPEGGKIIVNPGEAQIVREVFALYQLHRSLLAVARIARERGWRTKAWRTRDGVWREGKPFTKPDVHRLLLNPVYMGMVLCHGELYPGQHEALVTPATFDRVQAMLEEGNRTGGAPGKNTCGALLRGLLRCGACGEAMIHEQAKRGPRLHRYYVCTGAQKRGAEACPSRRMPAQELEAFVVDHLRAIMQDDGVRADVVAEALAYQTAHAAAAAEEAGHLRAERQRLKEGNTRLVGQLAVGDIDGAVTDGIRRQIASTEQTIAALSSRLRALAAEQAVLASVTVDGDQVVQALASFDRIWDVLEPRERERLVRLCLDHVEVDRHAGTLRLHLHPLGLRALGDEFGGPAATEE